MTSPDPAKDSDSSLTGVTRVLFVDDNAAIRQSAQESLESAGYSVLLAADGFEALACVQQWCPDVVVADIMMPRLDGYQMCALLKSNADFQDIPVIMLSSKNGLFDQERACLVGSNTYLAKPFSAQALTSALDATSRPEPTGG